MRLSVILFLVSTTLASYDAASAATKSGLSTLASSDATQSLHATDSKRPDVLKSSETENGDKDNLNGEDEERKSTPAVQTLLVPWSALPERYEMLTTLKSVAREILEADSFQNKVNALVSQWYKSRISLRGVKAAYSETGTPIEKEAVRVFARMKNENRQQPQVVPRSGEFKKPV